jgi:CRISPR-associated protein (TIGR03986 family)
MTNRWHFSSTHNGGRNGPGQGRPGGGGQNPGGQPEIKPGPYRFVPVPAATQAVAEGPVWHDGAMVRREALLSGEIRLSIEALTPLLVGNDQYTLAGVDPAIRGTWRVLPSTPLDKKKVLEPLRLPDGRVVIPGTALKGMLRQSLGALLGAPMERVAERKYTYRPNIDFARGGPVRREPRVAIVREWSEDRVVVSVLPHRALQNSVFVRNDAAGLLRLSEERLAAAPGGIRFDRVEPNVVLEQQRSTKPFRMMRRPGEKATLSHVAFRYIGGLDGDGTLARAHAQVHGGTGGVYRWAMVRTADLISANDTEVPDEVIAGYDETATRLSDRVHGHLRSEHPLTADFGGGGEADGLARRIRAAANQAKNPDTLVFVEVELANDGTITRVCSIGHNFLYRWAYNGTVRTLEAGTQRREVTPLPAEREADEAGRPRRLSGARLLFGYVASDGPHDPASGIGRDAHRQFAGRLAFNAAVEHVDPTTGPAQRFLSPDTGFTVPLKILGMPRPSAVEAYVDQSRQPTRRSGPGGDRGTLVTYGDVPGERSGDLNGRKFYLHQPAARTDALVYTTTDDGQIKSDQAMLARFVSVPGATFRATLRFRDLRPWELGAVLAALEPERVFRAWDAKGRIRTGKPWEDIKNQMKADGADPLFASKLGHGRPIGMGSVRVAVDGVSVVGDDGGLATVPMDRVNEFAAAFTHDGGRLLALDGRTVLAWLDVHRYRGRTRTPYPTASDKERPPTIYDYHTGHRRAHASGRRTRP